MILLKNILVNSGYEYYSCSARAIVMRSANNGAIPFISFYWGSATSGNHTARFH